MTNSNSINNKKELRDTFKAHRLSLNKEFVHHNSTLICQKVIKSAEFQDSKTVHCYSPIEENNEVNTEMILKAVLDGEKNLVMPKISGEGVLTHHKVESLKDLEMNKWGVSEPTNKTVVSVTDIDVVIVPMVAGDFHRNRLGYGKGFYDRFLININGLKIGLLFEVQLSDNILPIEPFDIKLDKLITEERVIY